MSFLDKFLFYYSTLFAIILTGVALLSGFNTSNTITIILFLPVSIYLIFQVIRQWYIFKHTRNTQVKSKPKKSKLENLLASATVKKAKGKPNQLSLFFSQKSPSFLITLGLFTMVISATFLKSALDYQPTSQLVSPVPIQQDSSQ